MTKKSPPPPFIIFLCWSVERRKLERNVCVPRSPDVWSHGCLRLRALMDDLMHVQGQTGHPLSSFDPVEQSCCHLSSPRVHSHKSMLEDTVVSFIMTKIPTPRKWNFNWKLRNPRFLLPFLFINQCHSAPFVSQTD